MRFERTRQVTNEIDLAQVRATILLGSPRVHFGYQEHLNGDSAFREIEVTDLAHAELSALETIAAAFKTHVVDSGGFE